MGHADDGELGARREQDAVHFSSVVLPAVAPADSARHPALGVHPCAVDARDVVDSSTLKHEEKRKTQNAKKDRRKRKISDCRRGD